MAIYNNITLGTLFLVFNAFSICWLLDEFQMGQISTNRPFKCEECDMSFSSQKVLEEHEKYASYRRKAVAGSNNDTVQ